MQRLGDMVSQMARYRSQWERLMKAAGTVSAPLAEPEAVPSRLAGVAHFGSNPGNLRMFIHVPLNVAPSPALVVVLHGCLQTAAGYDHGAGWSTLADRYGFVLLFPEQQEANNPKRCFNWFKPGDIQRGRGEAGSIRQMIDRVVRDHAVDRRRVFVTGLSAGGAMTSAMLAAYPDLFAGGAVIAGLPYRCATNVSEALDCMFQGRTRAAQEWGDLVRSASPHRGPWPKVSVWHGSADTTVMPMNAGEVIKQWTNVHGLPADPSRDEVVDGYPRRVWTDSAGEDVIEEYTITGMAHGTPLATGEGENSYGAAGPFLLDAGISSSYHIARFWGLTERTHGTARDEAPLESVHRNPVPATAAATSEIQAVRGEAAADGKPEREAPKAPIDRGSIIKRALKSAGLMR